MCIVHFKKRSKRKLEEEDTNDKRQAKDNAQGLSDAGARHRNTLERGIDKSSPWIGDKST